MHFKNKLSYYKGEVSQVNGFPNYNEMISVSQSSFQLKSQTILKEMDELSKRFQGIDITKSSEQSETLRKQLSSFATPEQWTNSKCPTEKEENTKNVFEGSIRW